MRNFDFKATLLMHTILRLPFCFVLFCLMLVILLSTTDVVSVIVVLLVHSEEKILGHFLDKPI